MPFKITDYPAKTIFNDGDLYDVSSFDGVSTYTSEKMTFLSLKTELNNFNGLGNSLQNIYSSNGTIGSSRVATITDTINFTGGLFGIGKTPLKTLDVNGDSNIDGDVYVDGFKFIHFPRLTGDINTQGNVMVGISSGLNASSGITTAAFFGKNSGYGVSSGQQNTALGNVSLGFLNNALITGDGNVAVGSASGQYISGNSNNNISIGSAAGFDIPKTLQATIGIGASAKVTADYQFAIGGASTVRRINDIIIGSLAPQSNAYGNQDLSLRAGRTSYTPISGTLDTDMEASSFTIAGGESTGTGAGGDLIFKTTTTGTTGTTFNALQERFKIGGGTGDIFLTGIQTSAGTSGSLYHDTVANVIKVSP